MKPSSSPLSNERHDIYISGNRSNSLTSFTSFNSTSNMSTMSSTNHSVPRGNSTNDLLFMESRFTRPSRMKNPQLKHTPLYHHSPSINASNGYVLAPRSLPRASSVPSIPQFSVQNAQPLKRPSLPTAKSQQLYPELRSSTSMNHIPTYGRGSLQSNPSNAAHHPPQQQRRHNQRPGFHNAPFTFPNGEVYTPRNKQRGSQTSLKTFHQLPSSKSHQGSLSSPSLSSVQLSSSASQQIFRPRQPLQQQQQPVSATTAVPNTTTPTTSPSPTHAPTGDQDLSLLTTGSNSYSSSPSPSRTSRTNSSVNESTPPSSIDDLTIHTSKADLTQLPPPLQYLESTPSNNLGKIEEHAVVDADQDVGTTTTASTDRTTESTPTSDSTQRTLEAQSAGEEAAVPADTSSVNGSNETVQLDESIDPKQPDYQYLKNVEESKAQTPSPQPVITQESSHAAISTPTTVPAPTSQIKYQTLPTTQIKSSPVPTKKPIFLQAPSTRASVQVERKPSLLKRIFSKVFSSDRKKSKSLKRRGGEDVKTQVKTPHFSSTAQEKPQAVTQSANSQPVNSLGAVKTPVGPKVEAPHHTLDPEADASDAFSFMDGDEDEGLKVETPDDKAHESDSSDFKSELVLDKLFSRLSTNESSEEVFKKLTDEKKKKKDETNKEPPKPDDASAKPTDDEDEIIQFDDMELIDKIIEFGETPFPDLAATDLGQSQRKLQRSKSIERKKSIRSISSSSRQLDEVIAQHNNPTEYFVSKNPQIEVIYSNQPKDPFPLIHSRPSILKKKSLERKPSTKKVDFTNQIYVNSTYPSYIYNRHSRSLSSYSLSPQLIHQIRHELNDFKRSMTIHESSKGNTHYFRA